MTKLTEEELVQIDSDTPCMFDGNPALLHLVKTNGVYNLYLLHNSEDAEYDGSRPKDFQKFKGYFCYSWWICEDFDIDDADIREGFLDKLDVDMTIDNECIRL